MSDEKIITHQDIIDGLHEEIEALRAEDLKREAWYQAAVKRIAALEKVVEAAKEIHDGDVGVTVAYPEWKALNDALRSAGYLGGGE
jgi:hypothetical protein